MTITQMWRSAKIVHVALLVSLAIYGVIVVVATRSTIVAKQTADPMIFVIAFGVASLAIQLAIPILRKKNLPERQPSGGPVDTDHRPDENESRALNRLRSACILTWAMCEAVAIFGVVLGFLFRDPLYYAPFGAVGALSMVLYAPTRALLESVVRAAQPSRPT
jgi:hypothetical protein